MEVIAVDASVKENGSQRAGKGDVRRSGGRENHLRSVEVKEDGLDRLHRDEGGCVPTKKLDPVYLWASFQQDRVAQYRYRWKMRYEHRIFLATRGR